MVDPPALYRRASNSIAAAMIYLQDNYLLDEPLAPDHLKFEVTAETSAA